MVVAADECSGEVLLRVCLRSVVSMQRGVCWVGILSIEMIPEGSTEMVLSPLLLEPAQQRRDMKYIDKGWERFYRSNVNELRQGNSLQVGMKGWLSWECFPELPVLNDLDTVAHC
ncbi:unnamed protein product [Brugia pahangi]|uniref:TF-B3 domain-containing protein n=1 Tax=Brugia pahangi TaxID=6280 RepID=A0A0N4TA45_BRUPA|nr:unnamed protein product [Brugia pahangi]